MPKSLGFLIATVVALVGCGSSGPDVPLMDWTVQVSGLARGAVAEFEVTGPEGETRSLALEVGPEFKLRDIRAGTYDIALQDVQLGDKTWTPTEALLQLELQLDGTAVNRATGAVVSTALYEIRLAYAAVLLGAAIADPVYPVFGVPQPPYVCDAATSGSCVQLATGCGINALTFPVSASGLVNAYFGTSADSNGDHWLIQCDPNNPGSCSYLDDSGAGNVVDMIYANNSLWAALDGVTPDPATGSEGPGLVWKCDPNVPDACAMFSDQICWKIPLGSSCGPLGTGGPLSLAYGADKLYVGIKGSSLGGSITACDPNSGDGTPWGAECTYAGTSGTESWLDNAGGPVQVLAYGNNRVYAGIGDGQGTLWSCDPGVRNSCLDLDKAYMGSTPFGITWTSMIYANNRVYAGFLDKNQSPHASIVWSCDPDNQDSCLVIFEEQKQKEQGVFGLQYTGNQLFFSSVYEANGTWYTDFWKCDPDLGSCAASGSLTLEHSFAYGACDASNPIATDG